MTIIKHDICIIGAGPAGLTVTAVAAQLGLSTALVENARMGGDCLNYGCVPSKTLLSNANKVFNCHRTTDWLNLGKLSDEIDWRRINEHVRDIMESVGERDSQQRFESLGATVYRQQGRFIDHKTFETASGRIQAKKFVIATGSHPFIPPIPGLESVDYLTNETVFSLNSQPEHLLIIGGGPIGCELAQAFKRLGCQVSVLEHHQMLPKDDPSMVDSIRQQFGRDGIALYEGGDIENVGMDGQTVHINLTHDNRAITLQGSHLLVATGRRPNVDRLGLETAGVTHSQTGIQVDKRLRTANKRIFAAGDVIGGYPFTHAAAYQASVIIKNAIFRLPAKTDYHALPWVTYTTPQLAQVGYTEKSAKQHGITYQLVTFALDDNDRFVIEGHSQGQLKVIVTPKGKIIGVTLVACGADDLITPWIMACQYRLTLKQLTELILPYPTKSEIVKQAASQFYAPKLFAPMTRKLAEWLI